MQGTWGQSAYEKKLGGKKGIRLKNPAGKLEKDRGSAKKGPATLQGKTIGALALGSGPRERGGEILV